MSGVGKERSVNCQLPSTSQLYAVDQVARDTILTIRRRHIMKMTTVHVSAARNIAKDHISWVISYNIILQYNMYTTETVTTELCFNQRKITQQSRWTIYTYMGRVKPLQSSQANKVHNFCNHEYKNKSNNLSIRSSSLHISTCKLNTKLRLATNPVI